MSAKTRNKGRTMRLNPETACAVDAMFRRMAEHSPIDAWTRPSSRRNDLNRKIQAMCQAVVNYDPLVSGAFFFPLVFEARNETREEQSQRMMLQALEAGKPIPSEEA